MALSFLGLVGYFRVSHFFFILLVTVLAQSCEFVPVHAFRNYLEQRVTLDRSIFLLLILLMLSFPLSIVAELFANLLSLTTLLILPLPSLLWSAVSSFMRLLWSTVSSSFLRSVIFSSLIWSAISPSLMRLFASSLVIIFAFSVIELFLSIALITSRFGSTLLQYSLYFCQLFFILCWSLFEFRIWLLITSSLSFLTFTHLIFLSSWRI